MSDKPIYVTQPNLPPLAEFVPLLQQIWDSKVLTNGGPQHQRLEAELARYFGVPYVCLFNNGTNALLTAIQALGLKGEVITTPYSFVATANSLVWNGLTPVFIDIDSQTLNIDPDLIEAAITERTTAIMPVHCYGNPCATARIAEIARKHNLKVIYDAAHAFGVNDAGGSVLRHGDLSVLSFHATKVFNTFEGGAVVCHDASMKRRIDQLKNFGIVDEVTVDEIGINGKMSEVNAAFGLLQLHYVDAAIERREAVDRYYRMRLADIKGIRCVQPSGQTRANYSYFPVLVEDGFPLNRDALFLRMREMGVFARRYFYPLIPDFPAYAGRAESKRFTLSVAKAAAANVLCLPIYADMTLPDAERVVDLLLKN